MDIHIIERDGYHTSISVINSVSRLQYLSLAVRQSKLRLQELWTFKGMIRTLVITDLKIRYKDSVLGVAWSLLNPLLMMVVFTVVFTVFRNSPVKDFPAFLLTGLLPWQLFANSVVSTTGSIVGNGYLISKIYFPKEILVISSVLSNLIHFLTRLLILFPILFVYHRPFTFWILLLPVVIFIETLFILGVGFILATANVFYRDVKMIMDVVLLAGFFLTPIFYSLEKLPRSYELFGVQLDVWRLTYYLNPMASIVANYRVILFDGSPPALDFLVRTLVTAILFLIIGLVVFYRYHLTFSEEV